jgi:S-ribosylhomocysteine lyase LuxS involved in autoinducer biosynthesis
MAETLETLAERLEQAERTIAELTLQLSWIVDGLVPNPPMGCKTGAEVIAHYRKDKQEGAKIFRELLDKMGIAEVEPISIEGLRKSMARHGIRAEDNEFSRAIIEEREK